MVTPSKNIHTSMLPYTPQVVWEKNAVSQLRIHGCLGHTAVKVKLGKSVNSSDGSCI